MEKVILVIALVVLSPLPPGRPQNCQEKAGPLEGGVGLKQGFCYGYQRGELVM